MEINKRKCIYIILICCFYVFAFSMEETPQTTQITITLKDDEIVLTPPQFEKLKTISKTINDMVIDIPGTPPELTFEEIPQEIFQFILENASIIANKNPQLVSLLQSIDESIILELAKIANFLDIEFLLNTAMSVYSNNFAFTDGILDIIFANEESFITYLDNFPLSDEMSVEIANKVPELVNLNLIKSLLHSIELTKCPDLEQNESIYSLSWSPDNTRFAIGTSFNNGLVYDNMGNQLFSLSINDHVTLPLGYKNLFWRGLQVDWHPSRNLIATNGFNHLKIFDASTSQELQNIADYGRRIAFWSPDGKMLAAQSNINGQLELLPVTQQGTVLPDKKIIVPQNEAISLSWNPTSQKIATFFSQVQFVDEKNIYIWNLDKLNIDKSLAFYGSIFDARWSPDQTKFAVVTSDYLYIYSYPDFKLLFIDDTSLPSKSYNSLSWHPNSNILSYSTDKAIALIDVKTWKKAILSVVKNFKPSCLAWNSRRTTIAVAHDPPDRESAIYIVKFPDFIKNFPHITKNLITLPQAQVLLYMMSRNMRLKDLPDYLANLLLDLPESLKKLLITEMRERPIEIIEPTAKRQKTE